MQEDRFVSFRFLIISYKKLYRKQPVEFLIPERIFFWKIRSEVLKTEFLKGVVHESNLQKWLIFWLSLPQRPTKINWYHSVANFMLISKILVAIPKISAFASATGGNVNHFFLIKFISSFGN